MLRQICGAWAPVDMQRKQVQPLSMERIFSTAAENQQSSFYHSHNNIISFDSQHRPMFIRVTLCILPDEKR